jgi:hypothetical protein
MKKNENTFGRVEISLEKSSLNSPLSISSKPKVKIDILCFDLGIFSTRVQFILLTSMIMIFFIAYGYLQEFLFELPGFENTTWFLTMYQFFWYSCISYFETRLKGKKFQR